MYKYKCEPHLHWHEQSSRHVALCEDSTAYLSFRAHVIGTTATTPIAKQGWNWYVYDASGKLINYGFDKNENNAISAANKIMQGVNGA